MKKIDIKLMNAVHNLREFRDKNTCAVFMYNDDPDNYRFDVALHGNTIFHVGRREGVYYYEFLTQGWNTNVTMARLNACASGLDLDVEFKIRNHVAHWFKGGKDMGEFGSITHKDVEAAS